MVESLTDQVMKKIEQVGELYYRLILLVAPAGAGKTAVLQEVQKRTGAQLVNVNLVLSRQMLDLTERQRILQLPVLLADIVNNVADELILLDNIEILFDVSLKQDPLRILQSISRSNTVVAAWNGSTDGNHLCYAEPNHQEYRRYIVRDVQLVGTGVTA